MPSARSRISSLALVGGRPCLDLANTVSWRATRDRRLDHLLEPSDGPEWCLRAGVIDRHEADLLTREVEEHPRRARVVIEELTSLRAHIWAYLVDVDVPDLEGLTPLVAATLRHCTLRAGDAAAQWTVPTFDRHTPARRIVLDLHDLLLHPSVASEGATTRCAAGPSSIPAVAETGAGVVPPTAATAIGFAGTTPDRAEATRDPDAQVPHRGAAGRNGGGRRAAVDR